MKGNFCIMFSSDEKIKFSALPDLGVICKLLPALCALTISQNFGSSTQFGQGNLGRDPGVVVSDVHLSPRGQRAAIAIPTRFVAHYHNFKHCLLGLRLKTSRKKFTKKPGWVEFYASPCWLSVAKIETEVDSNKLISLTLSLAPAPKSH